MLKPGKASKRQRGVTLIEVLVALVVLSIGLVGLSRLQVKGVQGGQSAMNRSQASVLIGDIIERMRANVSAAKAGNYNVSWTATPSAAGCSTVCTAAQVAADDLFQWRFNVERLPGGESEISVTANGTATVGLRWYDARGGASKLTLNVVTTL